MDRFRMQLVWINGVYKVASLLLTSTYLYHLIPRVLMIVPTYSVLYWTKFGESDIQQIAFTSTILVWIIVEYAIHTNYKARAELFIENAINKQQQE